MGQPDFPIIGIGASAGGIDAFHSFFDHMPSDCGMAFVMILHLPAGRKSMLTEILMRWTSMRVLEGLDGMEILPNCVYVPPPHSIVTLRGGRLDVQLNTDSSERVFRPIDGFFDSLGAELREQSVGIVLSGTGSDGALGLKAIKACGGLTFAQGSNGTVPQYGQMPAGAIATGAVDLIVPVENMPAHLLRLKGGDRDKDSAGPAVEDVQQTNDARLQICDILRAELGHDFSGYRAQTFLRRVERRMQVVDAATLRDYIKKLQADHDEVRSLFRDLLIRVTRFFRDQEIFEALQARVIPQLFEGKDAESTVRVWVPGCATGEEAYSLAMLLREQMDGMNRLPRVQLFATDIDDLAIATARVGRYPPTLLEELSQSRRGRFFHLTQGSYMVAKEIRDMCTFSTHNLVRDPPFSRMNLVSCRNLLIYMNTQLQAKVIPIFHYSLVPGGILLLGGSESVSQHGDLFDPIDKVARIFQRRDVRGPDLQLMLQRQPISPTDAGRMPRTGLRDGHLPPTTTAASQTSAREHRMHHQDQSDRSRRTTPPGPDPLQGTLPLNAESLARLQGARLNDAEELRSLQEEHQTALEELRSANEELHSVNEEMQSTNEELETSKEELQSLNEELHTVNVRLTEKVDELDQTNSDLRNLFDSTQIATIFLDRHLVIRSFTPAIAELYHLIPSDSGRPLTHIVSRLRYDHIREDVSHVLQTLEQLERRVVRDDDSSHYIMRILPYRDPDSTVSGVLVTFVNVTSIVRAENALKEADIAKDVFLATLSHELRNPLAPIRTAAHVLQSADLDPAQLQRAQEIISRQVSHMSSLLDDLLDVSRITRGAFALKRSYVDVHSLLDGAVEAAQPFIDAKQHSLRVERLTTPLTVDVDPVRITQVINNLLTNAAKYTPSNGAIQVGVKTDAEQFEIFVRDNGIGIEHDSRFRVFEMFTQLDSDIKKTEGGLGIGLALAKGLVELHGGTLDVRSDGAGKGSEFRVLLPRTLVHEDTNAAGTADSVVPDAQTRRILVADDNRDGAETMGMLLEISGHDVHLAHSGLAAFENAKEHRPDVVILDIGMPDMDGYEVAHRIRQEAWGASMLLIAVTGWGQAEDKRRAIAAGFDHHMTKPIDPDELERLIVSV